MNCIALYCNEQGKEIGYMLEDCHIYFEEDLTKLIRTGKIEVRNLKLLEDGKLFLIDTEEIKYESKAREKHAYGAFARAIDSYLYIKLETGENLRFINRKLLKEYEHEEFTVHASILDTVENIKTKRFLNKAILMYGPDSVRKIKIGSSTNSKDYVYILKTDNNYNILFIPDDIKEIDDYVLRATLQLLKGTLKVMGCEELESAPGLFRDIKTLDKIDFTSAKLNKLRDLSEMFYNTKANIVRLGDLPLVNDLDLTLAFSSCEIDKVYLGKTKAIDNIYLNEAFSFSQIGELHLEGLDTRECIVNIKQIFKRATIGFINAPNLSVKTSIENYDILLNGNIYLPFLDCKIGKDGGGQIGTEEEHREYKVEFINNCTYMKQMYNRRNDKRRQKLTCFN